MLIALHKYSAALALILVGFFAVCAISDGFDGAQAQIEMQANAEFDTDDFDEDDTLDFCLDGFETSNRSYFSLTVNVFCGKAQTVAKRSLAQIWGLIHCLAPNKNADNHTVATHLEITQDGADFGSHHLFFIHSLTINFSKNEKIIFCRAYGYGVHRKRLFG